jgi:hypothetical protein
MYHRISWGKMEECIHMTPISHFQSEQFHNMGTVRSVINKIKFDLCIEIKFIVWKFQTTYPQEMKVTPIFQLTGMTRFFFFLSLARPVKPNLNLTCILWSIALFKRKRASNDIQITIYANPNKTGVYSGSREG